jgi:hypothetical protein
MDIERLHMAPGRRPLGGLLYEDVVGALAAIAAKPKVGPARAWPVTRS